MGITGLSRLRRNVTYIFAGIALTLVPSGTTFLEGLEKKTKLRKSNQKYKKNMAK